MNEQINHPKTMTGWAMYDWANSSYALVINTALFPLYFQAVMGNGTHFTAFWTVCQRECGIQLFTHTVVFNLGISLARVLIYCGQSR